MSIPDPVVLLDARARYVHPAFQMSRASTKTVFDSTGRLVTVPPNAIGWDHDPATGQNRGYLAEPSATNLLLHSNDLTQGAWSKTRSSITPDAITGPDGNGMAKLVEDSSSGLHQLRQAFTITDGATVAFSPVLKAGERTQAVVYIMRDSNNINNAHCTVNLADGTVSGAASSGTGGLVDAQVMPLGGGFFRLALMGTLGSGVTDARVEVRPLDGNGNQSYQGDGTSGLYLGYCQAEEGSYPTSYIETGASTVTRAGDGLFLRNLEQQGWWRSRQGTILLSASGVMPYSGIRRYFIINGNLGVRLAGPSSNLIGMVGDTLDSTVTLASPAAGSRHTIAATWGGGEAAISVNGGSVTTAQMIAEPTASADLGVGSNYNTNTGNLGGYISRAVYYPQRISNADLQSLTAMQE